jgi:hypothetical protein
VIAGLLILAVFVVLLAVWAWGSRYGRRKTAAARRSLERGEMLGRSRVGL